MVSPHGERGTAAVEFALLMPLLLLLVLGVIDFGRAFNAKLTVTHAAREGARTLAVTADPALAELAAIQAATGTPVVVMPGECLSGEPANVSVTHVFSFITPLSAMGVLSGDALSITSVGSMRCGG